MTVRGAAGAVRVTLEVDVVLPGGTWGLRSTIDAMAWHCDDVRHRRDVLTAVHRLQLDSIEHRRPQVLAKAIRGARRRVRRSAGPSSRSTCLRADHAAARVRGGEPRLGGKVNGEPVTLFGLFAASSAPFDVTGQPACDIPAGFVDGRPVGLQVVAWRHRHDRCLAAGQCSRRPGHGRGWRR